MTDFQKGQAVIAYGNTKGVVMSDRLNFDAYEVKSEPVPVKGKKRRRRVTMIVHESQMEAAR